MKIKTAFLLILALLLTSPVRGAYSQEGKYGVFLTRFCTVFYEEGVDLEKVNRRINLRFSRFYSHRIQREKYGRNNLSTEDILSEKLDAIFVRVQEILEMYQPRISITINIYRDKYSLDAAYEEIFNLPNESKSFYVYKTNTVYTTQDVLTEGILAHEMAHCIIDHYFVILPPRKIQEMLAVYADLHLKD